MTIPLLATKLYVPPVGPKLVPRPRLIEQLNAGFGRKLTLISAPAGFGKTTLLSEWVACCGRPVAWLSLDRADNDPARFWAYFITALQTIHEDVGGAALAALQSPQPPAIELVLTGLVNEATRISDPFALVLDDFHVITNQSVNDAITFLLDNLPPHMHLTLCSREDPPWPLARMRARREMMELRANDLRFTTEETAAFLNAAMKLDLSAEDVATLEARTEGWIVGLQMAALSMQGQRDLSAFIRAFTGSHRFILDYLVEEVLDQQPPGIQDFLLKTSILDRMTAPLCDAVHFGEADTARRFAGSAVTGGDDSRTILAQLEQANLFLVPLDDQRRWYRYHHLFADLLRNHLEWTQADEVPALHRRASVWYEQNNLVAEAVRHAQAAQDVDRSARLIAENALAVIYQGGLTTVIGWLEALPEEMVRSRPWLCIGRAWAQAYAGQLDAVEPVLQDAQRPQNASGEFIDEGSSDPPGSAQVPGRDRLSDLTAGERRRIEGHSAAIRAYAAFLRWDRLRGTQLAREALAHLPEEDLAVRGLAAMLLAMGLYGSGDLVAADRAFAEAITASKAANYSHVAINALCELADLQITQGQLNKAAATCREALQMASTAQRQGGGQLPMAGYAYGRMSVLLREWNNLADAVQHARRCVELSTYWGQADALILGHVFLAGALLAAGCVGDSLDAIQEAKRIASAVSSRYRDFVAAEEARLRVAMGDVAGAIRWVQQGGLSPDDEPCRPIARYIILARVLIARASSRVGSKPCHPDETLAEVHHSDEGLALKRTLDGALALLTRLLTMAEAAEAQGHAIEILTLQAMALQAGGKTNQALATLERALYLAEPEGYVRTFIDEGAPMGELLRQAAARGIRLDYVRKLLAALQGETAEERRTSRLTPSSLIEPLSKRELEVLRLLTTHLSSTEIAQELFIAASTVRSHIKSIYGKLNVHSRKNAIQQAKELDLL